MKKVIIVGAGVAGLAAAQKLKSNNFDVLILEARGNIGGRIITDRSIANFPVELGAEFIHGDKTAIWDFIDKNKTIPFGHHEKISIKIGENWVEDNRLKIFEDAYKSLDRYDLNTKDMSIKEWVETLDFPDDVKEVTGYRLSHVYLAKGEEISTKESAHENNVDHSGDGNFLIKDGFDVLVKNLAEGLEIKKNTVVQQVVHDDMKVKVICNDGGVEFVADAVILAVPISILQKEKIKFIPNLPESKLKAVESIMMGSVTKVVLSFSKSFWDISSSFFITINPNSVWWSPSKGRNGTDNIFTAFLANDEAREIDKLDEKSAIDKTLKKLSIIFNQDVSKIFLKGKVISWDKEPWILGGYSFIPVGAFGAREALAKSVENKIFFAGEATAYNTNPATV
ncbi:MAG TPA: NAD(P)/FAD-dependent oxidoreductase, partial [Candidatus Paceibacterota bacterium]